MRCANCDAEIPESGRFCVECGTPAPESALEVGQTAATGATERLPAPAGGPVCASCGTRNPPGAAFCVTCGRALAGRPVADRPASPIPPMPLPAPIAPAAAAPAPARPGNSAMWGGIGGGLFLIGLAALAITGWWWPGILILVGISSLVGSLASGQSI